MKRLNIPLAIADDDLLLVDLLKEYLEQFDRFSVVFTAKDGHRFLEGLGQLHHRFPAIALIDLRMEGMDGIQLLTVLKECYAGLHVIVLSSHYQDHALGFMVKNGVAAFVPKGISPRVLVQVLDEVMERGFFLLPAQVDVIRKQMSPQSVAPAIDPFRLTEREIQVLRLLAQQKTAKEIADELFIATRTVEGHKNSLFAKTGAKNLAGLVLFAIQQKLIDPGQFTL